MDSVEKLLAIEEIKGLKAHYFQLLDTKQWAEWEKLFAPDLVTEFPDDRPDLPPYKGRREFVKAIEESLGPALTIHHGHTPQIEILSATRARGLWAMQDWLRWPPGTAPTELGCNNIVGWGHYHEAYHKADEGWQIASLKLTRLAIDRS